MIKLIQRVRKVFRKKSAAQEEEEQTAVEDSNDRFSENFNRIDAYQENLNKNYVKKDAESMNYASASQSNSLRQPIKVKSSSDEERSLVASTHSSIAVDKKPASDPTYTLANDSNRNFNTSLNKNVFHPTNPDQRLDSNFQNPVIPPGLTINPLTQSPIDNVPPTSNPKSSLTSPLRMHHKSFVQNQHKDDRDHESHPFTRKTALVGFPPSLNRRIPNSSYNLDNLLSFRRQNRPLYTTQSLSHPLKNRFFNYEIDYPIENVFIDENIPSSMAIKINDTVESDRLGNAYRSQRYVYEPIVQKLNIGDNQQLQRRLVGNSYRSGIRYMREIPNEHSYLPKNQYNQTYPTQNLNDLQQLLNNNSKLNYQIVSPLDGLYLYSQPIAHYTAWALPNDPMRIY